MIYYGQEGMRDLGAIRNLALLKAREDSVILYTCKYQEGSDWDVRLSTVEHLQIGDTILDITFPSDLDDILSS